MRLRAEWAGLAFLACTAGAAAGQAMFARDGADAAGFETPADFRRVFEKEIASWDKVVKMPAFAEASR